MSPRHVRRALGAAALLVAAPLLAACGDDRDPVAPVAVLPVSAQSLDSVADLLAPLLASPVYQGFLLGGGDGLPFESPFLPEVRGEAAAATLPARPRGQLSLLTIPDSLRGLTFVRGNGALLFDWLVDTLANGTPRPGAPANGIRLVIERTDYEGDGQRERVGHMDVVQGGSASAPQLTAEVFDLDGRRLLRYTAGSATGAGSGWVEAGTARVDEVTTAATNGTRTRFTGSGSLTLSATRDRIFSRSGIQYVNEMPVGGHVLRLHTSELDRSDDDIAITYTVLVDGAPFARLTGSLFSMGDWEHVAEDRALTSAERAQVNAFLRALRRIPEPSQAWEEALFALFMLTSPEL